MSKVYALNEGFYSVDQTKRFIPFNPAIHDKKDRPASLFVHVQPFLMELENDLILLDTGLGYTNEQGELVLHENIRKHGYAPGDVTKVIMSQLHYDHAGGMVIEEGNRFRMAFPDADYFIQKDELEFALSKESKSYKKEALEELRRFSGLQLMEGDGWINSSIEYEITGAHCPFHQVIKIRDQQQTYFYGGDIMPEAHQVLHKIIAKYDYDGRRAMELRAEYANKAMVENWKCLMYHDHNHGIVEFEEFEKGIRIKSSVFSIE